MKKILLLFAALFVISSCSLEPDEKPPYTIEFLPAKRVFYPAWVEPGHTYQVTVGFEKPNGCYLFDRFHSEEAGDAIIIAVQAMVSTDGECKNYEIENYNEQTFTFACDEEYASTNTNYTFNFFTGYDVQGNKTYEQIVIPVNK